MNRNLTPLISLIIIALGCNTKNSAPVVKQVDTTSAITNNDNSVNLKDISEYKLGLIGSSIFKVTEILGEPDEKGESNSGRSGHYVYFDKVKENGAAKHLVIYYNYDSRYSEYQTIKTVSAVLNGFSFSQPRYGSFKVVKPKGFGIKITDIEKRVGEIQKEYQSLDLNKLENYSEAYYGKNATYFYDDNLRLRLIKQSYTFSASNNGVRTETYFFIDDEVKYILTEDNLNDFPPSEKYVQNNSVIRYSLGGNVLECTYQCRFDKSSIPYRMLERFNSQWAD
ncbi:MAG: hypothetical protein EOO87_06465 [Pedobacter sp.]|nr:MAG: hypothetical protein EOO87_06465 [Pedobacter sp.]